MLTVVIILIVAELLYFVITTIIRNRVSKQLSVLLQQKNFLEFDNKLKKYHIVFPRFNYEFFQMQKNVMTKNTAGVLENVQRMEKVAMHDQQLESMYAVAFQYFMDSEDWNYAKLIRDKIDNLKDNTLRFTADVMYDSIAAKGHKYQNELLTKIQDQTDPQRSFYELMLSYIYLNMNDQEKAKKYKELSEKHIREDMQHFRKAN